VLIRGREDDLEAQSAKESVDHTPVTKAKWADGDLQSLDSILGAIGTEEGMGGEKIRPGGQVPLHPLCRHPFDGSRVQDENGLPQMGTDLLEDMPKLPDGDGQDQDARIAGLLKGNKSHTWGRR
jgi:hypothetical protein